MPSLCTGPRTHEVSTPTYGYSVHSQTIISQVHASHYVTFIERTCEWDLTKWADSERVLLSSYTSVKRCQRGCKYVFNLRAETTTRRSHPLFCTGQRADQQRGDKKQKAGEMSGFGNDNGNLLTRNTTNMRNNKLTRAEICLFTAPTQYKLHVHKDKEQHKRCKKEK